MNNLAEVRLACPSCGGRFDRDHCPGCGRDFDPVAGLPDYRLASDRYLDLHAERDKAERLAKIAESTDLEGVARSYYAMTADADPVRCRRFIRHILGAESRGELVASRLASGPILELGCGTGGLIVAARRRGLEIEGVDIASRWLVVARRRLVDRGMTAPLIAASAEALPYADGSFGTVVADSLIEHLEDPRRALAECRRVLRPGGRLLLVSPNRTSLLSDPHVRLWGVGFLPRRLAQAYVRGRRGTWLPRLMTASGAARMVGEAGFVDVEAGSIPIPSGSRQSIAFRLHERLRRFRATRPLLRRFGPLWMIEARR